MMSLRRFAVITPLMFKYNKQNISNVANLTTNAQMHSAKGTTPSTTTNVNIKQTQSATTAITTATDSNKYNNHRIIDNDGYADESSDNNSYDDSNETYTNIINKYAAGNGLQTIRASFGISGLIGHSPGGISSGGNIGSGHQTYPHAINGNANLLLCGAMLSVVTTILCVVCYCCHRNIKKRTEAAYRQQHQWLESDPNMEIYSVEQSYETSGLFLGESGEGLTTVATLHHEPPPSYDAVVAMQEQQLIQQQFYQQQCHLQQQRQQQQQIHLQHNSPPPGYRSTLAVNEMATPTMSASAATSNLAMDTLNNDSNGNLSGSCNISISGNSIGGNSCSNFFACGKPNTPSSRYNASNNNSNNAAFINMKKVLNAQSCCSLQRAEVENMWNAAAAAVAVRATHATSSPCGATNLTGGSAASSSSSNSNRNHISPMLLPRKSLPLPLTLPAKLTAKRGGRRYLPHHSTYYRRGCPLCGKFRYDADETLMLSVESELDVSTTFSTLPATTSAAVKTSATTETAARSNSELKLADSCQQLTAINDDESKDESLQVEVCGEHAMAAVVTASNTDPLDNDELERCACAVRILESPSTIIMDGDSNGNNNNNAVPTNTNNNADAGSKEVMIDQNANGQTMIEELTTPAENAARDMVVANGKRGLAIAEIATSSQCTTDVAMPKLPEDTTLDAINGNSGIIRVDMSKVIDQTGLPTYEAAAKLESSGYV
ncbi:uncharacterized protein LOC128866142 [Anastrepha ludens]|uniref:uncharacterized protein LOC128866142 n=1 Tax=Anastrepha ludens TaxID=28586 RepID=UPI0023B0CDCB|nr:uncharacterized protein LOC128866142 [Anastrepha ludens]